MAPYISEIGILTLFGIETVDASTEDLYQSTSAQPKISLLSWGHKEQRVWSLVRHGLLANVSAGVSVTTECLSGGKWLLYTTGLWP